MKRSKPLSAKDLAQGEAIAKRLRLVLPEGFTVRFCEATKDTWLVYTPGGIRSGGFSKHGGDIWYRVAADLGCGEFGNSTGTPCPKIYDMLTRHALSIVLPEANRVCIPA